MKRIITALIILILIMGAGYCGYWYGTKKNDRRPDPSALLQDNPVSQLQEQNSEESWEITGVYDLEGYMEVDHVFCIEGAWGCDSDWDYAYFVITKADNNSIYNLLGSGEGNSYLKKDAIGLGCYESDKNRIFSYNSSLKMEKDFTTENIIAGAELESLKRSHEGRQVKLQVERPQSVGGRGAPNCYSHFINFKVLN